MASDSVIATWTAVSALATLATAWFAYSAGRATRAMKAIEAHRHRLERHEALKATLAGHNGPFTQGAYSADLAERIRNAQRRSESLYGLLYTSPQGLSSKRLGRDAERELDLALDELAALCDEANTAMRNHIDRIAEARRKEEQNSRRLQ